MTTDLTLPASFLDALAARWPPVAPSEVPTRRPVHVVYGGAHLFQSGSAGKIADRARAAMGTWGADDLAFGRAIGLADAAMAARVASRVRDKLERDAVEAICIDFEDGYGRNGDAEEDGDALRTAAELAEVPPGRPLIGVRIKSLTQGTWRRGLRTLDLFVTHLAKKHRALRDGFTVTLPKVTKAEEVSMLVDALERLEGSMHIERPIGVELMIESKSALVDARGTIAVPSLVEAARGRAVALHLGAYDLTADLGVTAGDQRLDHPLCDLARMLLQLASPVPVSDGATTLLPTPPKDGSTVDKEAAVHRAWSIHARNVTRAIEVGVWQGWDLHPAQLPARYGALFAHFFSHRDALATRLGSFVEQAMKASRVGQVFDDAATVQGLSIFFLRGLACGAFDERDLPLPRTQLEGLVRRPA